MRAAAALLQQLAAGRAVEQLSAVVAVNSISINSRIRQQPLPGCQSVQQLHVPHVQCCREYPAAAAVAEAVAVAAA